MTPSSRYVLAVVGLPGSGKSTLVDLFKESYGLARVYFGGIVLNEVVNRGLTPGPLSERTVRESLRVEFGMDAIAKLATPRIDRAISSGRNVVIDGMYSMAEYEYLFARYDDLQTIAIHAARTVRYQRLAERQVRSLTAFEAKERDLVEVRALDKGGPIALADLHYVNDRGLDSLANFCRTVMEGLQQTEDGVMIISTKKYGRRKLSTISEAWDSINRLKPGKAELKQLLGTVDQLTVGGPLSEDGEKLLTLIASKLAEYDQEIIVQLGNQLGHAEHSVPRRVFADTLGAMGQEVFIPYLMVAINDESDDVALWAALSIAKVGESSLQAVREIVPIVNKPSRLVLLYDALLKMKSVRAGDVERIIEDKLQRSPGGWYEVLQNFRRYNDANR
ncbi:MAG: AAA family ATPase [Pseudonocardiaceae bacterium]